VNDKTIRTNLRVTAAAFLVFLVWGLAAPPASAKDKEPAPPPEHYRIAIVPKAALKDLLPTPPKDALPSGALIVEDLSRVPEVMLHEPVLVARVKEDVRPDLQKATAHTARLTAHINFVNRHKTERFLELLMENRPDLAGLPFAMGDACRLKAGDRKQFKTAVEFVQASGVPSCGSWLGYDSKRRREEVKGLEDRFCAAACMQMLALQRCETRLGLVKRLAAFDKTDEDKTAATHALTKLAIFSQEAEVRHAAIDALRKRAQGADNAVLLHGLRYPWPSVAQSAADLASALKRKDLVPELIKMLDEPDPRAPAAQEIKGKKTPVLREIVRINHHRNCLLCHPPGNAPDVMTIQPLDKDAKNNTWEIEKGVEAMYCEITKQADDVLVGAVPTPGLPLPGASDGYHRFSSPDLLVRADITYLRQDFSLLQKVADADPWPEVQRFDYLIRCRVLTEQQAAAYHAEFAKRQTPSPYRQAALAALRNLTGQDAGISAAAWRDAVGVK
jgi:hypothetical protein